MFTLSHTRHCLLCDTADVACCATQQIMSTGSRSPQFLLCDTEANREAGTPSSKYCLTVCPCWQMRRLGFLSLGCCHICTYFSLFPGPCPLGPCGPGPYGSGPCGLPGPLRVRSHNLHAVFMLGSARQPFPRRSTASDGHGPHGQCG